MTVYRIECHAEGQKFLARVARLTGTDQREGDQYEVVAVALASTEQAAIWEASCEAFGGTGVSLLRKDPS